MSILIKNGRVVTPQDDQVADVFIDVGKISAIGQNLDAEADRTIDASGKLVIPGGIDPHVHLEMPSGDSFSSDNYESGTLAALHGGTTTVMDFVIQTKGKSLYEALREWQGRANGNVYCDYAFHMAVTDFNPETRLEIKDIIEKEGITSFKIFMAYKGSLMIDDGQIAGLMNEVRKHGGIVCAHATNGDMIDHLVEQNKAAGNLSPYYHYLSQPGITESEATGRFIDLAYRTRSESYIVHMSCEGAVNLVREAQKRNQRVFAETCIQYLVLDSSVYDRGFESAKWVISPPIREKRDQEALWTAMNEGIIQTLATDHCPFMWSDKFKGKSDFSKIPNGAPGIEHRLELIFSEGVNKGKISLHKMVEITSTAPAKIFGIYPKKGTIEVGSDADLVIFNPTRKHVLSASTHHHHCDYSAYEGFEVTGKAETVILRGNVAIDNGAVKIKKGYGEFIKRSSGENGMTGNKAGGSIKIL